MKVNADKWEALYARDRWDVSDRLRKFILEHFGERRSTFEPGCPTCKLWKLRDDFEQIVK